MIILDTSTIIEILKKTEKGEKINTFIEGQESAITSFSVHELIIGAKEKELSVLERVFTSLEIFNFDLIAALESSKIEKKLIENGKTIEESDIFIAGICLANNSMLITLDRDFEKIEGLDFKIF